VLDPHCYADRTLMATSGEGPVRHGQEGVDGSSPSEGFVELPANRAVVLSIP